MAIGRRVKVFTQDKRTDDEHEHLVNSWIAENEGKEGFNVEAVSSAIKTGGIRQIILLYRTNVD